LPVMSGRHAWWLVEKALADSITRTSNKENQPVISVFEIRGTNMAESERSRFDLRILVLFLILGMVPLIVGALLLMSSARTIYQESIEEHLVETAEFTQSLISTHLQQRIIDVAGITAIPTIRERVREANQTLLPVDQLRDHVDEVETQWGTLIAPSQS